MIEGDMKIGAVGNLGALRKRVLISDLRVMSRAEAKEAGYQTRWPALVPAIPPREATSEELLPHITASADSNTHLIFMRIEEKGISAITRHSGNGASTTFIPQDERPSIQLIPGVEAQLRSISSLLSGEPTAAKFYPQNNPTAPTAPPDPDFFVGSYTGLHFDGGSKVETRDTDSRRIVVNLGPGDRYSLLVVPYSVVDMAQWLHPNEREYVPKNDELLPQLLERTKESEKGIKVIWTRLKPNEGYVLPARNAVHNGGSYGLTLPHRAAYLFETDKRWQGKDLLPYSVFK